VGHPSSAVSDHSAEKDRAAICEAFVHPCGISPLEGKETFWECRVAALLTPRGTRDRDPTSNGNKIKGLLKLILASLSLLHIAVLPGEPRTANCTAEVCKERCYHPLSV